MNLLCRVFLAAAFIAAANLAANEPKDFAAMTLNLSDRQLSNVPEELLLQNDLEELWLDSNQIRKVPDYKSMIPLLRLSRAVAAVGFTVKRGTWNSRHSKLYQFNRRHLESLAAGEKTFACSCPKHLTSVAEPLLPNFVTTG